MIKKILNCSYLEGEINNGKLNFDDFNSYESEVLLSNDKNYKAFPISRDKYSALIKKGDLNKLLYINHYPNKITVFYFSFDKKLSEKELKNLVFNDNYKMLLSCTFDLKTNEFKYKEQIIQKETKKSFIVKTEIDQHYEINIEQFNLNLNKNSNKNLEQFTASRIFDYSEDLFEIKKEECKNLIRKQVEYLISYYKLKASSLQAIKPALE